MADEDRGAEAAEEGPAALKSTLRAGVRARRAARTPAERAEAAEALTRWLIQLCELSGARTVSCYLSREDEPSTRGFLDRAREGKLEVLLPLSHPDGRLGWVIDDGSETADPLGLPAPGGLELPGRALDAAALAIVPAAMVGRDGSRLGWGRGYFDRALGSLAYRPPVYAVVFDDEFVDELPREAHDIPVDGVVTPSGITVL